MCTLCRLSEIASYLILLCALQSQPSNLSNVLFGFTAVSRLRKLKSKNLQKFLASGPAVFSCQSQAQPEPAAPTDIILGIFPAAPDYSNLSSWPS